MAKKEKETVRERQRAKTIFDFDIIYILSSRYIKTKCYLLWTTGGEG